MTTEKPVVVAILTAGGMAPCLSAAVGGLIERYTEVAPAAKIICYLDGYQGLLAGRSVEVTPEVRARAGVLQYWGGSPIGNSRVKLSDAAGCAKRGLVKEGQDPREVAAAQLEADGVTVLHTIGGDDTNTAAADLAAFMAARGQTLTVVGLPKTIDNDIVPVRQSLGAWTAAEQTARFMENVVTEVTTAPRVLLITEVMGRSSGYLTAAAARRCMALHAAHSAEACAAGWLPALGMRPERFALHAVYVPELALDVDAEAARLKTVMDRVGNVNIFMSESAGVEAVVADMRARGEALPLDPFGHVWLDKINPGAWFGSRFAKLVGAEKVLVQKSGYFSRSAAPNAEDLRLIKGCVDLAVDSGLRGVPGLVGHDEQRGGVLRTIEFDRVAGAKPFDTRAPHNAWFPKLLQEIGQPLTEVVTGFHL